ncbi:MAG: hypothetical protein AB7P04_08150 [Bacteriovoracia bacterium]
MKKNFKLRFTTYTLALIVIAAGLTPNADATVRQCKCACKGEHGRATYLIDVPDDANAVKVCQNLVARTCKLDLTDEIGTFTSCSVISAAREIFEGDLGIESSIDASAADFEAYEKN